MLFPLTAYPIFASKIGEKSSTERLKSYNSMKTSRIKQVYVIEMAKPSKKFYQFGY